MAPGARPDFVQPGAPHNYDARGSGFADAGAGYEPPATAMMPPASTGKLPTPGPSLYEDDGQTGGMPSFSQPAAREDQPTSAMSSDWSGFGASPANQAAEAPTSFEQTDAPTAFQPPARSSEPVRPPEPADDEHESHTMILSSLPSIRTGTRLVVIDGPVHGRQFSLGRQLTTIGRSIGCHVTVESDDVAYDHARIVRASDGWQIELIGGAAGLFVNDQPVQQPRSLRNGDVVRVVPARLRFESTGQAG